MSKSFILGLYRLVFQDSTKDLRKPSYKELELFLSSAPLISGSNPILFSHLGLLNIDHGFVHGQVLLSSVQLLSCVWLFATPWTSARQASLSVTNSQSLPKLMSIESVMPSSHLILCCPLLLLPSIFPASGSFQISQLFASGGQSIQVSASASVLPMNTQDWSPLGWTGWITLQSKGLSRVFSNTTVQKHQFCSQLFFIVQLSHPYMTTGKTIALTRQTFVGKVMSLA